MTNLTVGTRVTVYDDGNFQGIVAHFDEDGDIMILRLDGEGWRAGSENKFLVGFDATQYLPKGIEATYWWVMEEDLKATVVAEATGPKEPTAPMTKDVLEYLRKKGTITQMEAGGVLKCRALPRRIADLKALGHNIVRELKKAPDGQRYARYHLAA